jgi:hypothetical protein
MHIGSVIFVVFTAVHWLQSLLICMCNGSSNLLKFFSFCRPALHLEFVPRYIGVIIFGKPSK